jgi:hypothetical protein
MKRLLTLALLAPLTANAADLKDNYAACLSEQYLDDMLRAVRVDDMRGADYLLDSYNCVLTSRDMEASFLGLEGLFSGVAKVRVYLPSGAVVLFVPTEALDEARP